MTSSLSTADFITSQIADSGIITSKKMFGEYALYCDSKVIAFVCDDTLFLKPTKEAKDFFPEAEDAPAYPGSKMYMLIPEEKWEDREFMSRLVTITYNVLPVQKPKKVKSLK